jgi:hypothetical protein
MPHLYEQRGLYLLLKGVGSGNVIELCQQQMIRQSVYACITISSFCTDGRVTQILLKENRFCVELM